MSTIVTDTLQGKTSATSITLPTTTNIGSTPLVSASANSMTIRGEGSAQTSIQQGLGKVFINFNGTSTIATRDSFNTSSIADLGTGNYRVVFSNNMSNGNYTNVLNCNNTSAFNAMYGSTDTGTGLPTTSQLEFFTCSAVTTNSDARTVQMTTFGDLA